MSEHRGTPACPSKLTLSRADHGELAADAAERIRAHVEGCERCAAYLAAAATARDALSPAASMAFARRVVERAEPRRSGWAWLRGPALLGAGACVALLLAVGLRGEPPEPAGEPDGILIKGTGSLTVHCKRAGETFVLAPDAPVRAGDALRFEIFSGAPQTHALVIGIDARGAVSVYAPFGGEAGVKITPGAPNLLDDAILLDDSGLDELLVALVSAQRIEAESAKRAARDAWAAAGRDLSAIERVPVEGVEQHLRLLRRVSP